MSRNKPTPIDREQPLGFDELFISTTDRKGHILLGNRTFMRVSGYPAGAMIGQAHNIVRHPDMPRAVFRLLWEYLEAGRPIGAYVKNISSDGSYYWVLAIAMRVEGGYLSVRLKPSSELFALAQRIYADLVSFERRVEGGDPKQRKAAIDASVQRLGVLLAEAGFADYDDFMHAALPREVACREQLHAAAADAKADASTAGDDPLARVLDACWTAHRSLDELVQVLRRYDTLGGTLAGKSEFVRNLANDVRLFALNAVLASSRLADGAPLAAVAELLGRSSVEVGEVIGKLGGEITETVGLLSEMSFRTAAAKLLTEMMTVFVGELIEGEHAGSDVVGQLRMLAEGARDSVQQIRSSLPQLQSRLQVLSRHVVSLRASLSVVRGLEFNGRLEAARAHADDSVHSLFETIGNNVEHAHREIRDFEAVDRLAALDHRERQQQAIDGVAAIARAVAELAAAAEHEPEPEPELAAV